MVYNPRTITQIYESLRDRLINRISGLTNFTETSFNFVWTNAYADRFRDAELALLATQFSGWVDYSGGPIQQDDLDALGITDVTADEVNQFMEDQDLDELVKIVGIDRDGGQKAAGVVTFTTQSQQTTIPSGTSVGTQPDSNGDFFEYVTTEEVSTASGVTEVDADIEAVEVGENYNTGSGTVTYLVNPPTGVQSVTNDNAIEGGDDPETNDELRERAKDAIFTTSGGGTAAGVTGYIESNVADVTSIAIKEYPGGNQSLASDSPSPGGPGGSSADTPFADVIVEGGNSSDINTAIDESRPVAIQHNLVRPIFITVGVDIDVTGSNIDTAAVEASLNTYLTGLDLNESVYRDQVIQRIMNADNGIDNITDLSVHIENETHTYDSDNSGGDAPNHPLYKLNKGDSMGYDSSEDSSSPGLTGIRDVTGTLSGSDHTFVEATDFDEGTVDGSSVDAIDWGLGGDNPDEDTDFNVTYEIAEDIPVDEYEKATPGSITVTEV